jgi:hypothetical protein
MLCWLRRGRDGRYLVVAMNFAPAPLNGYCTRWRLDEPAGHTLPPLAAVVLRLA